MIRIRKIHLIGFICYSIIRLISVANAQHHIRRGIDQVELAIHSVDERSRILKGQSSSHRNLVTIARAKKKKKQKKKQLSLTTNDESIYNTINNSGGGRAKQKMKGKKNKKGLKKNIFFNNNDGRFNMKKKTKNKTNGRFMNKKKGMKKKKQQQLLLQTNNNQVETRDQFLTMKNTGIGCLQQSTPYRTCVDRQSNRESIIHTYIPPYTSPTEQLMDGQVYLSLIQDNTPVNCTTIEQLEEYTLSYLVDNIGYNRKFDLACVQVDDRGYDRSGIQIVGNDNDNNSQRKENVFNRQLQREVIKSNTLRLHVTYVEKNIDDTSTQQQDIEDIGEEEEVLFNVDSTIEKIYQDDEELQQLHAQGRSLQPNTGADECTQIQRALCCTQHSINNERGEWCSKLGCNVQRCGTGRRRREDNNFFNRRDLVEEEEEDEGMLEEHRVEEKGGEHIPPVTNSINNRANNRRLAYPLRPYILKDKEYTVGLNKYTEFEAVESWSQLNMENVDNVAVCSANRYGVVEYGTPTLTCEEFKQVYVCSANDDMLPKVTPLNGGCFTAEGKLVGVPTPRPTQKKTPPPTDSPTTYQPTIEPTELPTESTDEPTGYPTRIPTMEPTEFICREEFDTCEIIEDCCSGLICLGEECVRPETELPTLSPSSQPTQMPTIITDTPTATPTYVELPTLLPTISPTFDSDFPTTEFTDLPTQFPTFFDDDETDFPTLEPTLNPTEEPTLSPTLNDGTPRPSASPSASPSDFPSTSPTALPSAQPTVSSQPTISSMPTDSPSISTQPTLSSLPTRTICGLELDSCGGNGDDECCSGFTCFDNFPLTGTDVCVMESSDLWFWGARSSIGYDGNTDVEQPTDIEERVYDASAGSEYTLVILNDRSPAVAGQIDNIDSEYRGHFGISRDDLQSGVNELQRIPTFVNLDGEAFNAPQMFKVYAGVESSNGSGDLHSVFIDIDGNIYASGYNNRGQLCLGDEGNREFPTQIEIPNNERAISAAVGIEFTLIVSDKNKLYGCGNNEFGQLGLGVASSKNTPDNGNGLNNVESVSAGSYHSLIGTNNGFYVMGRNNYNQLCSTGGDESRPIKIDEYQEYSSFVAGSESSYIILNTGTSAISCGRNDVGQLGNGSTSDESSAGTTVNRENMGNSRIESVRSGLSSRSVFFETSEGKLFGTGLNDRGQLGVGDKSNRSTPTEIQFNQGGNGGGVSSSDTHTLAW